MKKKWNLEKLAGVCLGCAVLLALPLRGQPSAATASQQQQNFRDRNQLRQPLASLKSGTNAPEMYPGENADVGPQNVLRLLPRRTWLMARVSNGCSRSLAIC